MGAINVYMEDTLTKRLGVCDGQQRLTTLSLLLGATRIQAIKTKNTKLVEEIDELLFHDMAAYKKWQEQYSVTDIKDGEYYDFFRVIPTYADRKQFYLAILDTEK